MGVFRFLKFFLFSSLFFLLAGCQPIGVNEGLKILDQNIGKIFSNFEENQASTTLNFFNKKNEPKAALTAADLTQEQKDKIDAWLEKNGWNRYGDAKNAVYTGGTPLFNEATGQPIERYDYLLNKIPDILERMEKDK